MDEFDFIEESPPRQFAFTGLIWNLATVIILVATLCLGGYFISLFLNPWGSGNPFPPPTPVTPIPFPTEGPTNTPLPPTPLPSATPTFINLPDTETPTPEPVTPLPTPTEVTLEAPTETQPSAGSAFYGLQDGNPAALESAIFEHLTALECEFMGVAGQALNLEGAPVVGLTVNVIGNLVGEDINVLSITGSAQDYGPGGYEVKLADEPVASTGTLRIQLMDVAGVPLSEVITFDTYGECNQNLILINFKQER